MESLVRNRVVDYEEVEQLRACASKALSNGASRCREWDSHIEGLNATLQSIRGQVSGEYISATFVSALQSANTPMYNEEYDELSESVSRNLDKLVNRYQEADLESAHAIALICDDLKICEEMLKELKSHVTNVFDTGCESSQFKTTLSKVNRYKDAISHPTRERLQESARDKQQKELANIEKWADPNYVMTKEDKELMRKYIKKYEESYPSIHFSEAQLQDMDENSFWRRQDPRSPKQQREYWTVRGKMNPIENFLVGMQDTTIAQAIEAIAEKYGYDMENEYISDWEVTRANAYKQMPILTNAGRITSTILEYAYGSQLAQGIPILNNAIQAGGQALSKLPILNKVGAEKITNVLGDTMLDTMYDTIPEAIRNVQGGKSAQEVTTATLKSVGKNVADNIVGEAALSLINGKLKTGYEKPSEELINQGVYEKSNINSTYQGDTSTRISNKFPNESMPSDGKVIDYYIENGRIKGIEGINNVDFVITLDNKFIIGNKHHYLEKGQDVLAVGQLKINGQGQIKRIDNLSGHYRPTVDEAMRYQSLFEGLELDLNKTWLEYYKIDIDTDGMVVDTYIDYVKMLGGEN